MKCRHCEAPLQLTVADLGFAPPSNAYLNENDLQRPEVWLPLRVRVCESCWLVQTQDFAGADNLFTDDYAYFSSTSSSWLEHAKLYSEAIIAELQLNQQHQVVEIACNDGYLLRNFIKRGILCLGIEPTASTAQAAASLGIKVRQAFFGNTLAKKLVAEQGKADLIIANNVYAHVPDINDFTLGIKTLLQPGGTVTLEFQHLLNILKYNQFDTLYHEHFCYHSLHAVETIMAAAGLRIFRVTELTTHGGSLRLYVCHADDPRANENSVTALRSQEVEFGLTQATTYTAFQERIETIKMQLLMFLLELKIAGKTIAAYGAAAKGNTLLNYAGITTDLVPYVCDAASSKQHKFMPGSHIPILPPNVIEERKPDYVLILPWNIGDEIKQQLHSLVNSGTRFVTAIPELRVL